MKEKQLITVILSLLFGSFLILSVIVSENSSSVNAFNSNDSQNVLIIDAGHGGEDGGAIAEDGTLEKDINLEIALQMKALSDLFGYKTIMIRESDCDLADHNLETIRKRKVSDIHARIEILQNNPDAIYVGIHQNYYEGTAVRGFQMFYSKNFESGKLIAEKIQDYANKKLQPQNARSAHAAGDNIYLLKNSPIPAVMVECGFLSNKDDLSLLKDSSYGTKLAMTILAGITDYYTDVRIL